MRLKNRSAKILLIDDNPKNLQVAMGILNKEGYNLIYAQDGKKGLELAQKGDFNLILLDIVMMGMDGYSVCQELKSNIKTKEIPIIFLTVKDEEQDIVKGFEYGGVDYITKPFYSEVLLRKVKTHINLSKTTKELKHLNENLARTVEEQVEKIRLKEQILFQQSKMAAMGEMIANIAHQWRQPLSAISTTAIGLKIKLQTEHFNLSNQEGVEKCIEDANKKLDDIEEYIGILSDTIDDFRNFFKPQKNVESFDIDTVVQKSIKLLEANFKDSHIRFINDTKNIEIVGFENELAQVLINILNNARDALIEQDDLAEKLIFISTKKSGDFLIISIKDSAGGIKEELLDKIYEPYFTTKHQSIGTGIGLYMSQEIIKKHMHGTIETKNVKYTYDKKYYFGAEFTIKIPLKIKGI